MEMTKKDAVLKKVFYDVTSGFGSIADTLRQAKLQDASITRVDVKRYLDKQEIRQSKKPKRYNSFIPSGRLEQIQIDLADFGKAQSEFRYGLVAVDIFTKHLEVIPLNGKTSAVTAQALDQVISRLGHPAVVLTDEGGEFQGVFEQRLKYYAIEHVVTRTPPIFVERVIRTIKEGLELRMKALSTHAWHTLIQGVVTKYNNAKHTAIGMTPLQARLEENAGTVKENITEKANRNRSYPELDIGDNVKIIRKPGKYAEFKAGFVNWSITTHRVESIEYENGSRVYKVSQRVRPLLRHELLKVEAVERAPRRRVAGKQEPAALIQRRVSGNGRQRLIGTRAQ